MRVALLNVGFPPGENGFRVAPPFGIMSIGAFLRQNGHEVRLFDWSSEVIDREKLEELDAFAPDVLGVHVKISSVIHRAVEVSRWAKERGITVMWGGPGPTLIPEVMLRDGPVDYLVLGEGEITACELLEALADGTDPLKVKGIGLMNGGTMILTPPRDRIMDLNELPLPLWGDLGDLVRYHTPMHGRMVVPIITSRGCPGNCAFCYTKIMWGYKWSALSPENVLREIEKVMSLDPRIGGFIIIDDLFATDRQRVRDVCRLIIERNLDIFWNCEIRADMVEPGLLEVMGRAGCRQILIGVETGSQRLLDLVRKDITVEDIRRATRLAHENKMEVYAMLVNGIPTETIEDVRETDRLLKEIRPDYTEFLAYMPYPGTPLYDLAVKEGFVPPTSLKEWGDIGTFSLNSLKDKGITEVSGSMYENMARRSRRRAIIHNYMKEFKKEPLTAPIRGLRMLMRGGDEEDDGEVRKK